MSEYIDILPAKEAGARPEISLRQCGGDQFIMCGYVPVVLAKMFGPMIFADIRVRADGLKCEWIIERETITPGPEGDKIEWVEWARIPGQIDSEY